MDTHPKVLLVEDNVGLAETVIDYLENSNFTVDYAQDGGVALHLASETRYNAIILDIMMPGIDGFEVCKRLRDDAIDTPIIMLTARDLLEDKLQGFSFGADDYLVKPFDMPELEARILALIKRNQGNPYQNQLSVHDLSFDLKTMLVQRGGKSIKLSPTCLRILKILMRESPNIVSREDLEQELWGDVVPDSDTLRSHLYNLRKSIDKDFDAPLLHTQQGIGFKIEYVKEQ